MSSILYWALLAVVCLSPLPLASNRPLPWSVLSLLVGILLLTWGSGRLWTALRRGRTGRPLAEVDVDSRRLHARRVDRRAAILSAGFAVLIIWYWVQATPSLGGAWGHVAWTRAAAALGETLPAAISLDPGAGQTLIMKIVAYGGIFLLAFELGRIRGRAHTAFWLVCLSGFAYALYGLFVHFASLGTVLWFSKDAYPESVTSTFVNRNAYATYAGMAMIAGLAPLLSEMRRVRRARLTPLQFIAMLSERGSTSLYLVALSTITGLVAVALTGSRAGMMCVLLALAVFAVGLLVSGDIRVRTFVIGAIVGGIAVTSVLMLSGGYLIKRLTTETAPEARAALFDVATIAASTHPWTGQGLGAFGPAFNLANDGSAIFETYVDLAHNAYLELAVEGGLPALALSILLIVSAVGISIAGMLSRSRGTSTSIAAVAIATLVATHSTVDFGIQMPAVAATFMLLIGMAASQALSSEPAGHVQRVSTEEHHHRRRRFGRDRPTSADEPVTPPPQLEIARPVHTIRDIRARISRQPTLMAPPENDGTGMHADSYETALARWRALRQAEADAAAAEQDASAHRLVSTRPPTPTLEESPKAASSGAAAYPPQAPQPAGVVFVPPVDDAPAPSHNRYIPGDDAAEAAQPPTPPDWPGVAAPAVAPKPDAAPYVGEGASRGTNIVDLRRKPRS